MYKEDYELIDEGMHNSYLIITGKMTFQDILDRDHDSIAILFDPDKDKETWDDEIIDRVIEYYADLEEYEKCQELLRIKNRK